MVFWSIFKVRDPSVWIEDENGINDFWEEESLVDFEELVVLHVRVCAGCELFCRALPWEGMPRIRGVRKLMLMLSVSAAGNN